MPLIETTDGEFISDIQLAPHQDLPSIMVASCRFHVAAYTDSLFDTYGVAFHPSVINAVVKRKSEFLAGRVMAKFAMAELGVTDFTLNIGQHRNPIWPERLVGSISHTIDQATCVLAKKEDVRSIGLDVEKWLPHSTVEEIQRSILSESEVEFLSGSHLDFDQAFTLVFSAKESLFKALYPDVRRYFDFSAAHITQLQLETQGFTLRLTENLCAQWCQGDEIAGSFVFDQDGVTTLIALPGENIL